MPRNWLQYVSNSYTDAGRSIVEQGKRLHDARIGLSEERYCDLLSKVGVTPRDARVLSTIGYRLHHLLGAMPDVKLPYRIRTLATLADLSTDAITVAADCGKIYPAMTESEARVLRGIGESKISPVIRPTDSWNFSKLRWPRIDGWEGHGYIPGDLYANCLWYYAREGDTILDPMAGSGMLLKVWEDRDQWYGDGVSGISITVSDLIPRGPYSCKIQKCDLLEFSPIVDADYIIVDPPYCGLVSGQYSKLPNDLANMDQSDWIKSMTSIAHNFFCTQPSFGRCTVIVPNNRDITTGDRVLFPEIVRRIFQEVGYRLYDVAYSSRRTQQKQGRKMGVLNTVARRSKVALADISEVLTFIKDAKLVT